jgi:anti-sigma-K factor RskA
MNLADPDDRAVACAEFVLGTLDEPDRTQFLAAMENDEALRTEVGFWQDRLLDLYQGIGSIEPSAGVWQRIDDVLGRENTRSPVTLPAEPPARVRPLGFTGGSSDMRSPLWQRLGFWQGLSGLAVAVTLLLSLFFIMRPPVPSLDAYVAVMQTAGNQAAWMVTVGSDGPVRIVPLSDRGPIPQGKSWQLWTKGKNASAPTSLGLLGAGATEIPREALPYLGEEQLFEVSLEPEGGSPTGRPTGPILSIGATQRI